MLQILPVSYHASNYFRLLLVFKRNPNLIYKIPCNFNCQMPSENQEHFQFCHQCFNQPKILHFNHANKHFFSVNEDSILSTGLHRNLLSFYTTIDGYQFRNRQTFDKELIQYDYIQNRSDILRQHQESGNRDVPRRLDTISQIPKRCAFWTHNGDFRTHALFMPFSDWPTKTNGAILDRSTDKQTSGDEIVLVTHFSFDRWGAFERLVENWKGMMSVALYISEAKLIDLYQWWETSSVLSRRDNIALHIGKAFITIYSRDSGIFFIRKILSHFFNQNLSD